MSPNPVRAVLEQWEPAAPGQAGAPPLHLASREPVIALPVSLMTPPPAAQTAEAQCPYCTEPLQPGARQCPLCLKALAAVPYTAAPAVTTAPVALAPPAAVAHVPAAPIAPAPVAAPPPAPVAAAAPSPAPAPPVSHEHDHVGALYKLEAPARCPECAQQIATIRVLRTIRVQVSFTSTLPRKGYVILCPECGGMLSAALSGVI